jgi:hypothetical protein
MSGIREITCNGSNGDDPKFPDFNHDFFWPKSRKCGKIIPSCNNETIVRKTRKAPYDTGHQVRSQIVASALSAADPPGSTSLVFSLL